MRFQFILLTLTLGLVFLPVDELGAHGGQFKPPVAGISTSTPGSGQQGGSGQGSAVQKGYSFPGGGPQVAFRETHWEFWWDFHHEPLLGLRNTLFSRTPATGVIDFPFEKISTDDKRSKLVHKLLVLLKDKHQSIRASAVIALARTRDAKVLPYIKATYRGDDVLNVRTMAVLALGITQNPEAVSILASIARDERESGEIRFFANVSLGLIGGEEAAVAFRDQLSPKGFKRLERDMQRAVAFAAGLTNSPTLAPLVRSLFVEGTSKDDITDSYLALSLGRLGDRAANPILIQALEKGSFQVRRSSAIALGVTASPSDKDVIQALEKTIATDADLMVKNFCTIALGRIGGEQSEKTLLRLFNTVSKAKLPFAALGIGLLGNADNGALLLQKFKTVHDNSTRSALALSLGLLRYTPALGELRRILDGKKDPVFRSYCAQAVGMMRDAESIDRLRKTCGEANDVELIRSCAIALGLIGDSGSTELMKGLMDRKNSEIIRSSAAYALGLIGDRNAIGLLSDLAEAEEYPSQVRTYAVVGLGLLSDDSPVPAISKITRNTNYTIMETYLYELFNIN